MREASSPPPGGRHTVMKAPRSRELLAVRQALRGPWKPGEARFRGPVPPEPSHRPPERRSGLWALQPVLSRLPRSLLRTALRAIRTRVGTRRRAPSSRRTTERPGACTHREPRTPRCHSERDTRARLWTSPRRARHAQGDLRAGRSARIRRARRSRERDLWRITRGGSPIGKPLEEGRDVTRVTMHGAVSASRKSAPCEKISSLHKVNHTLCPIWSTRERSALLARGC